MPSQYLRQHRWSRRGAFRAGAANGLLLQTVFNSAPVRILRNVVASLDGGATLVHTLVLILAVRLQNVHGGLRVALLVALTFDTGEVKAVSEDTLLLHLQRDETREGDEPFLMSRCTFCRYSLHARFITPCSLHERFSTHILDSIG